MSPPAGASPARDASAECVIDVANVTYAYEPDQKPVVDDVSLHVRRGEFFGVLGPNGAGKSTLLRLIGGLAPAGRGRITIAGRDLGSFSRPELARTVALVPQRENTVFGFSAREVVAMGRAPHTGWFGALGAADGAIIDASLAACDATAFAARPMAELSGGEQKRVLVARALAQRAPVILLDEPVAFLDVKHQIDVCELLAAGVSRGDFTVLAVLHDLNLAAQFCSRIAMLREGRLVAAGTVDEVMTYRTIRETFDADVYVGENEINGTRYFVPMRVPR